MRSLLVLMSAVLLSGTLPAEARREPQKKTNLSERQPVMAMHIEVIGPDKDDVPKEFVEGVTKRLWRNWLGRMPQSAMLGDSGKVIVRFQVYRNRTDAAAPPVLETSVGKHMQPLNEAAIKAIRDTTKKLKFPEAFARPQIDLRVKFLYNLPDEPDQPESN